MRRGGNLLGSLLGATRCDVAFGVPGFRALVPVDHASPGEVDAPLRAAPAGPGPPVIQLPQALSTLARAT